MSEQRACRICGAVHECHHEEEERKKQTTRMIKLACPACGYTVRTTRRWIEVGLPWCPCETQMQEIAK